MNPGATAIGLFSLLLAVALPSLAIADDCQHYDPAIVSFRGTLSQRTYPGPPNFESLKHGDAAETFTFLQLDKAICTTSPIDELIDLPEANVVEVQLAIPDAQTNDVKKLLRAPVVATGTLFHSSNQHHHTRVLLLIRELRSAAAAAPGHAAPAAATKTTKPATKPAPDKK